MKRRHVWRSHGRRTECKHCGVARKLLKKGKNKGVIPVYVLSDGSKVLKAIPSCVKKTGQPPARSVNSTAHSANPRVVGPLPNSGSQWVMVPVAYAPTPLMTANEAAGYLAFSSISGFLDAVSSGEVPEKIRADGAWLKSDLDAYVDRLRSERARKKAEESAARIREEQAAVARRALRSTHADTVGVPSPVVITETVEPTTGGAAVSDDTEIRVVDALPSHVD